MGAALILLVVLKLALKKELPRGRGTLLVGGALTGGLSGLCGSGGPIGAAVFLSLDLPPVAYIASEAATATAMHILKIFVYSKLSALDGRALLIGLAMGGCMVLGTYAPAASSAAWTRATFSGTWRCCCAPWACTWY